MMIVDMDDLSFVRSELEKVALKDLEQVVDGSGVPVDTAIKIKYGTTINPRYDTVAALARHLRAKAAGGARPAAAN